VDLDTGIPTLHQMTALLLLLLCVHLTTGHLNCRPQPLGLMSHTIRDWQLAASSVVSRAADPECAVKHARLYAPGALGWCPEHARENEWILVDLGVQSQVSGVMTQGRHNKGSLAWVTHYYISYSEDAYRWDWARDIYGIKKLFRGNNDSHSVKVSYLEHPVTARFLRLHVHTWHHHPSLRMEILGCQECNSIISELPFTQLEASSHKSSKRRQNVCGPGDGHIHSSGGWCPKRSNEHQWLQLDLGPATLVTGVVTRGRGDKKNWVTSYSLSYSNDTNLWFYYKDANHLEAKVESQWSNGSLESGAHTFGGNMDIKTERRHYLNVPMVTRYIRIHPLTWRKRIGLRAGVIGCPHTGECGPGFLRVNDKAGCIPNKAFQGKTWVNDKRHTWKQWKYGHSSLAVDGNENTNLPNCGIMDNFYVDKPVFMVDLGSNTEVNGVVIMTWQGAGQDQITAYTDYVHNLDQLSVYVSSQQQLDFVSLSTEAKCGTITRRNTALFNPRLHFDCETPMEGRYVYVKATGVPNRWRKLFNVVLCEVMVY